MGYLRGLGVVAQPGQWVPETVVEVLLEEFRRYLVEERGLAAASVRAYVRYGGLFLTELGASLDAFVVPREALRHELGQWGGTLADNLFFAPTSISLGCTHRNMELSEYQELAARTSTLRLGGPQGAIAPMLGLASETGSILNAYKRYLRDGVDVDANREQLQEELGDLLWYAAAIATSFRLDLDEIAAANLRRTRDRYDQRPSAERLAALPNFDEAFPSTERFPRRLTIEFVEQVTDTGQLVASMRLTAAQPNAFGHGPIERVGGKFQGFEVGGALGDGLTDNTRRADNYRFHDALHLGFMAVLGWSPNTRALLRLKRKSNAQIDEYEDGARAIFAEEGLAAVLSRMASRRGGFLRETTVDNEVIELAQAATHGLESELLPGWVWRRAISQGFMAMAALGANGGGYLIADLDDRSLTYHKVLDG
ncbi:MAG: MazG nucleotide pyrophosphohydrolase domain-containing protein [Pseudonocardia sp.]